MKYYDNIVILFCYNVEKYLPEVCDKIIISNILKFSDVLFIDDCSDDNTIAIIDTFIAKYKNASKIENKQNFGYGINYKISINHVLRNNYKKLVFLHGDGQYPAHKVEELIKKFDTNDFCQASRFINKNSAYKNMPYLRIFANRLLTLFINFLFRDNSTEYFSGFRGFNVKVFENLDLNKFQNRWIIEQEMHLYFLIKKFKTDEIEIETTYGDRVSLVPPIKYTLDVVITSIKFFLIKIKFLKL